MEVKKLNFDIISLGNEIVNLNKKIIQLNDTIVDLTNQKNSLETELETLKNSLVETSLIEKNSIIKTNFINKKILKSIFYLTVSCCAVGGGFATYTLISKSLAIPSLTAGIVKIIEISLAEILSKFGLQKDLKFNLLDSVGREYVVQISKNSSNIFIKLSDTSLIQISDYINQIGAGSFPATEGLIHITPESVNLMSSAL